MKSAVWKLITKLFLVLSVITACHGFADAQTTASQDGNNTDSINATELLKRLDRLVDQNAQLVRQNQE